MTINANFIYTNDAKAHDEWAAQEKSRQKYCADQSIGAVLSGSLSHQDSWHRLVVYRFILIVCILSGIYRFGTALHNVEKPEFEHLL